MNTITAATIEETIKAGRIIEAKTLLTMRESALGAEERHRFTVEIEERQARAEAAIAQAEALEVSGKTEEAKELYATVLDFAADYPGIEEHIKRANEAVLLAKAVQRRNRRLRETTPKPPPQTAKKNLLPLIGGGLAAGLVIAVLTLVLTKPQPASPPEKAATPATAVTVPPAVPPTPQAQTVSGPSQEKPPATPPTKEKATLSAAPAPEATPHPDTASTAATAIASPSATPEETKTAQAAPNHVAAVEPTASQPADEPRKPSDMYTVQSGDSLSLIATRQFCYEDYWKKIYQLNRDRITDPSKLQIGMVLRLNGIESRCPSPHN